MTLQAMKKILTYLSAAACLAGLAACEDHRSDHLEDFQTMAYFRNGGEMDIVLYRTGEDHVEDISVCKAGRNVQGEISVQVIPFDKAQMDAYNYINESLYTMLPSDLFAFKTAKTGGSYLGNQECVELDFGPTDSYLLLHLELDVEGILALQTANPDTDYRIGLQLFSEGKISDKVNTILLNPQVKVPKAYITKTGEDRYTYSSSDDEVAVYTNSVTLEVDENIWDGLTATISVLDQAWLDRYNNAAGRQYTLLPADAFSVSPLTLPFEKGAVISEFKLNVDRTKMDIATEYALPVMLTSCSKKEFEVDQEPYLIVVSLNPDRITLTSDMVKVSTSSTYASDAGGAPALVDNDVKTYWHSPWEKVIASPDPVYGAYIDIELNTALEMIAFEYCTRQGNANGVPTHIVFGVSPDGTTYTNVGACKNDEMASAAAGQWVMLPVTKFGGKYKYLRIGVAESVAGDLRKTYATASEQPFTAISEIRIYGK